jgi:hypothetical protein
MEQALSDHALGRRDDCLVDEMVPLEELEDAVSGNEAGATGDENALLARPRSTESEGLSCFQREIDLRLGSLESAGDQAFACIQA